MRTDVRHEPVGVTQNPPIHGACSDIGMQTDTSTQATANESTVQRNQLQYGSGQGVKRMIFTEQEPSVRPSTSSSRNTDNNGMY